MKNTMRMVFIIRYSLFIVHPSLTKYDGTEEENQ